MELIDSLIKEGWLKSPKVIEAFRKIKRIDFLPAAPLGDEPCPLYGREDIKDFAELNEALSIGFGQTISQPLVVAFMIEELSSEPGDKILDVGSGSGWATALLAEIVGKKDGQGRVVALEIVPELKEFGQKNVEKYNFIKKGIAEFICADGSLGYEKEAPYDKILCSATVQNEIPKAWKEQLKVGGRIITPIGTSIWKLTKKSDREFEEKEYPGFVFVPLITK